MTATVSWVSACKHCLEFRFDITGVCLVKLRDLVGKDDEFSYGVIQDEY